MKWIIAILILIIFTAGCTQSNIPKEEVQGFDLRILRTSWAFEDNCEQGIQSVGYVDVDCGSADIKCEVYVNQNKSNFGTNGLQDCIDQIVVAEIELEDRPEFISMASGNKYYYATRDKSKTIQICCSYIDPLTNKLNREYQICQTTRLEAQCPTFLPPTASGFAEINVIPLEVRTDGTLDVRFKSKLGQNAVIRKIYINDIAPSIYDLPLSSGIQSRVITLTGAPIGKSGDGYSIKISIEYYLGMIGETYYNSTGTITGKYA
jgi:hypothetical protein